MALELASQEQYYDGSFTKRLKLENGPGNRLEEPDLEKHEWNKEVIHNGYLLLHTIYPKCSVLEKKSNFMVKKPGKHSFNQVSKLTSSVLSIGSHDKDNSLQWYFFLKKNP